jgi:hypothetical protein
VGRPVARMRDGESPLARPHGRRRGSRRSWGRLITFWLFILLLGAGVAVRLTFALVPPHTLAGGAAVLSAEKRAQLDQELEFSRPFDRDQAIDFALDYTAASLWPSLSPGQASSLEFGLGKRKGAPADYAALFVVAFEAASKRVGSTARAWPVRSDVRVFNKVIPMKSLAEHDWILVRDPADGARIYLDPMLYDAMLGSSLARNVKGGESIAVPTGDPSPPAAGDARK